jgi:hypothetical protein
MYNDDMLKIFKAHPDILGHSIGGNKGKVNTWESVDLNRLTAGVYPSYDFLLKDYNFVCLALQQAIFHAPLWLDKIYMNSSRANKLILDAVPYFSYLNCPGPVPFGDREFRQFPGWNRSFTWDEWN